MPDPVTIAVSVIGGSVGGTGLGWWQASRAQQVTRRGRARLMHEDLYRLQSTVTRLYHQTDRERDWGEEAWLIPPLAKEPDTLDVVAHVKGWRFVELASALGWADYLRAGYRKLPRGPSDQELERMYRQFAAGRLAVKKQAGLDYATHNPIDLVPANDIRRNADDPLPKLDELAVRKTTAGSSRS